MENAKIYETINAVMADVKALGKDRVNKDQNFKFRGVEDLMNTLQPILKAHKLFIVPVVKEQLRERKTTSKGGELMYSILKVDYDFIAEDGSKITATVVGEGMDSADKASNKAMSAAFKYACFQVFCIPTEEMADPDAEDPTKPAEASKSDINLTSYKPETEKPVAPVAPVEKPKSKYEQVAELLETSDLTGKDVSAWIEKATGKKIKVNDLTDEIFAELLKDIGSPAHQIGGVGNVGEDKG